jgi:hypothetical protein
MPYAELNGIYVRETIEKLERRIAERFPGSGLSRVSAELGGLASAAEAQIERLQKPMWLPRIGAALGILGMLAIAAGLIMIAVGGPRDMGGLSEFLQGIEAAANEVILLAVGLFFMLSIETRVKRRAVLKALYRLRSIIHVVDMHQLTKDPEFFISPHMATATSPARTLTRFEMVRYLDYCSELFSLSSKVAALYLQHVNDAVVLAAVNDIESLAMSLSHKVWQKIMILDRVADAAERGANPAAHEGEVLLDPGGLTA